MGDVIICNLTRFGDLLQTQGLINDLHCKGFKVGLICLENFAPAAALLRNVERVWPLPGARLRALLDKDWHKSVEELLAYARTVIKEGKPEYVLNLTPTLPARLLVKLVGAGGAKIIGFGLDEYGYGINDSVWASFFAVAAQKRHNAPFNVADMLRSLGLSLSGGIQPDFQLQLPENESGWINEFLASAPAQKFMAFQLGASEDRRRWPVASFAELGDRLFKSFGIVPILLGSKGEIGLGEEYGSLAKHPFLNAIGKTNLSQLGALLKKSSLLVTNDTGTMHLASGLGVKSLAIFLATAQPCDTGPLLDGCCCLDPNLDCHPCAFGQECGNAHKCRTAIHAEAVFDLISGWLKSGDWRMGITPTVDRDCRVWITGHDGEGFADVQCVGAHASDGRIIWQRWLRNFWRQLLDSMAKKKMSSLPENPFEGLPSPGQFTSVAHVLRNASSLLDSIAAYGQILSRNRNAGQLFLKNCDLLQNLLQSSPPLGTMAAFWREYRQNQGDRLDEFLSGINILSKSFLGLANALEKSEDHGKVIAKTK